jgi:poly(3-hydroxybutyrate) depolymerase
LAAGINSFRLVSVAPAGWNINWLEITKGGTTTTTTTSNVPTTSSSTTTTQSTTTTTTLPQTYRIQAESYNNMFGVMIESTTDVGGGQALGYINPGDWMDYNFNFPTAGTYTLNFRIACPNNGSSFYVKVGGNTVATVYVPNTGGYQTWQTISVTANFPAGQQTIRIESAFTYGWNFNWFEITAGGTTPTSSSSTTTTTTAATTSSSSSSTTSTTTSAGSNIVTIQVTFASPPASASSSFADLKYNKEGVFNLEFDDRSTHALDAKAYFQGGTAPNLGGTYGAKTFNDGTGISKPWTVSVATNVLTDAYGQDWSAQGGQTINQLQGFTNGGNSIENHGYYHEIGGASWTANNFDQSKNVYEATKWILNNTGYYPRVFVIPSAWQGYSQIAEAQGYLASTSQNVTDGYQSIPINTWNMQQGDVTTLSAGFHSYLREFTDQWDVQSIIDELKVKIKKLVDDSTPSVHKLLRLGLHGINNWANFKSVMDYLYTYSADSIWVTSLQEMIEYFEAKGNVIKTESLSGNVLTITLNYSNIPVNNRYRDLTLKINSATAISGITVSGGDSSTYSTTTKIVNIYKQKTSGFVLPVLSTTTSTTLAAPTTSTSSTTTSYISTSSTTTNSAGYTQDAKLPLNISHFYQDNNADRPYDWIDGNLSTGFLPGWSMWLSPHKIYYKFPERWETIVKKIRIYAPTQGYQNIAPTQIWLIRKDNFQAVKVGDYTQSQLGAWVEFPVTSLFVADMILIVGTNPNNSGQGNGYFYGNEIEVIGDYKNLSFTAPARPKQPLGNMMGVNTFWWDITFGVQYDPSKVFMPKFSRFLEMGISSARLYCDHKQFQDSKELFSFEPTVSNFRTDVVVNGLKNKPLEYGERPIVRLMCIQGQAPHIEQTWEAAGWNDGDKWSVTPVRYADRDKRDIPQSYDSVARMAFVATARYGRNTSVPDALMGSYRPSPNTWDPSNVMLKGMDLVDYLEMGNEWDAFWATKYHYTSPNMMPALWSAVYDGHKGTIDAGFGAGKGVGIKNADPTMKMVATGLAGASIQHLKATYDWSRQYRGYLPDGTVDLPFDVINYHHYTTNGGLSQYGSASCAMPVEFTAVIDQFKEFLAFSDEYCKGKEIWLSEWGYDFHPQSVFGVPEVSGRSREEVVAIWSLRWMLLYSMAGLDRAQWFKMFGTYQSDGSQTPTQFDTMQLVDDEYVATGGLQWPTPAGTNTNPTYERRPVGDFFAQLKQYRDYKPDADLSTGNVKVLRFKDDNGKVIYFVWGLETPFSTTASKFTSWEGVTTKNVTGFNENTGTYNLALPTGTPVRIKSFLKDTTVMGAVDTVVSNNSLPVQWGMTPKVIEISNGAVTTTTTIAPTTQSTTTTTTAAGTYVGRQKIDSFKINSTGTTAPGLTWLPTTYSSDPSTTKYPLIIFLHGMGESSSNGPVNILTNTGLPQLIANGFNVEAVNPVDSKTYKFIVCSPQHSWFCFGYPEIEYILNDIITKYRVDTTRIYFTGLSAGSQGTVSSATNTQALAQRVAAIVPISFTGFNTTGEQANMPKAGGLWGVKLWAAVGQNDTQADAYNKTVAMVSSYNSGNPNPQGILTVVPGQGHSAGTWNLIYDPQFKVNSINTQGKSIYEWMLQYTRPLPSTEYSLALPPTVLNQGAEGSCAPAALCHARSIEWYYKTGQWVTFSIEFLYNQTVFNGDCSAGTSMQAVLDLAKLKGVATNAAMPYSDTNGCALQPNQAQLDNAAIYKISGYDKFLSSDRAAIKAHLDAKHPVFASVTADNTYMNAGPGFIWRTKTAGNIGHATCFVGYDDSKNAWKVINSKGTIWGDGGFAWIDYDLFPTVTGTYVYSIIN